MNLTRRRWSFYSTIAYRILSITSNDKANSGDKWNVPVGLFAGKTIKIGKMPVNIKAGLEDSVVSPEAFGQRSQFRFQITPVIPSLIKNPIFGK
jgi:hypothetical protein